MKVRLKSLLKVVTVFVCLFITTTDVTQAQTAGKQLAYEVKVVRNLRYAEKPEGVYVVDTSSDRLLDVYLPVDEGREKRPVILFIHGGGFAGGDKSNNEQFWKDLASHGFVVVSANYRLYRKFNKPSGSSAGANMNKGLRPTGKFHPTLQKAIATASDDATRAFEWIKENADTYRMDTQRVAVSGGSAGAMAILYLAFASGQQVLPIRAVVNMWGGLQDASVIGEGAPPLLTFHGDQDDHIHVDYARALDSRMKEIGGVSELYVLEDEKHALYKLIHKKYIGTIVSFLRRVIP